MRREFEMKSAHAQSPASESSAQVAPRLRIAGVDPELGFGGGETQVLGLTLALAAAGHEAELICDPAGRLWERATEAGIRCHPLRIRNALDISAAIRLRGILKREHYDIVHFHTSRAHSMAPLVRGFAPALIVTRRMDYRPNRIFAPYLFKRAVDCVVAISNGVANSLAAAGVDRSCITVVPSGVDCERFRPPSADERAHARARFGISEREIAIAAIGALEPRKGHRYLIEAVAALAQSGVMLRCFVAGDGSIRADLERQVAEQRCAGRVAILGRIEDSRELLWASDIYAMPSLNEGLGVAALEAMASGLPAIVSATGGLREVVENDVSGILVEPARADEIGAAIARLANSAEIRAKVGAAARVRVEANYSMESMARQTLGLYRAALEKSRSERGSMK
jgi:glycosyltransferase involved in cell wall biosynthesis